MNIKAERIEQMIQIINRNLLLAFAGQQQGIVPLEMKQLQKVDTVIFGHDKFAFEMVHFVKSASGSLKNDGHVSSVWEKNFVHGLETLLVECAVVNDDIERDCFVSRVYCWFTEKLAERRELPRPGPKGTDDLKSSLRKLNMESYHTTRGLDSFDPSNSPDVASKFRNQALMGSAQTVGFSDTYGTHDRDLPGLAVPDRKSKFGSRKVPVYVKHGFPAVLNSTFEGQQSFLPKIPGATENYGMIYNVPETEAEKNMHELWMARRRQEAFEWKTQQHLALVMDRLALHKSRMESDSLRRTESGNLLKVKNRPASAGDAILNKTYGATRPSTERSSRSNKILSPRDQTNNVRSHLHPQGIYNDMDESASHLTSHHKFGEGTTVADINKVTTNLRVSKDGLEGEAHISKPARVTVAKPKKEFLPMRFKIELPDTFNIDNNQHYMQLSDSDDDDRPDRIPSHTHGRSGTGGGGASSKGKKKPAASQGGKLPDAKFKHEVPVIRERPVSAKQFRAISAADPEFKVHYRHTNYRRMPLTEEQEQWLDEKELARVKKSSEVAHQLHEAVQAKADKKKDKDKGGAKKDGDAKKKDGKKDATVTEPTEEKIKPKYPTAALFMNANFPNFEGNDNPSTIGPMRAMQLVEVARVMGTFEEYGINIKENILRKALIIPQDRPEAICLENMRETTTEGLMTNPLPKEYWRAMTIKKGGGKKKKRSKK